MQKSRQYSSPPQVSQQKKGANEHFCATEALDAADDSKGTQKPAGNGLSPHVSARRSPQPSARSKTRVNGYNTFTTDTNSAYSIPAKGSSRLAFTSRPGYDSAVDDALHPSCWSWRHGLRNRVRGTTYVSMLETGRERDLFGSYQIGFGARIRRNKAFIEVLFSFNR